MSRLAVTTLGFAALGVGASLAAVSAFASIYNPSIVIGIAVAVAAIGLMVGRLRRAGARWAFASLLTIGTVLATLWLLLDITALCMGLAGDCFAGPQGASLWLAWAAIAFGGFLLGGIWRSRVVVTEVLPRSRLTSDVQQR